MPITTSDIKIYKTKSNASADGESGGNGLGGYRSSDAVVTNVDENLFDNVTAAESEAGDIEYRAFMIKNTHSTLSFVNAKVYLSVIGSSPISDLTTQLESDGSETTVDVTDASDFPSSGAFFVEEEEITYTGKTGNQFTGCVRGANGTLKASHAVGVYAEHNQIRIAVEEPSNKSSGYITIIADESSEPSSVPIWSSPYSFSTGLSIGTLAPGEFYGIWLRRKIPAGCKAKTGILYCIVRKGETEE
jgi:hypothetical protein